MWRFVYVPAEYLLRTKPVQFALEKFDIYLMEDILVNLCRLGTHFLEMKNEDAELKPGNELNGKGLSRLPKMYLKLWFKSFSSFLCSPPA